MKRFIILILLLMFTCTICVAKNSELPVIKFKGNVFSLLYSAKNESVGTYMNEYYKPKEGYNNWTELIAVHYYPNAYSPINQAHAMRDFLGAGLCPSALEEDEENNSAILDFVLIENKSFPIIVEFNIFKYEKSPICGTIALQYAKRYRVNNGIDIDNVKKDFAKSRTKLIKQVNNITIPDLVTVDIDNGKYLDEAKIESVDKKKVKVKNNSELQESVAEDDKD